MQKIKHTKYVSVEIWLASEPKLLAVTRRQLPAQRETGLKKQTADPAQETLRESKVKKLSKRDSALMPSSGWVVQ